MVVCKFCFVGNIGGLTVTERGELIPPSSEVGVNLRVKIGIAVGEVIFYHIANENERHFGEAGETIEEVNTAQNNAASGTVVVSLSLSLSSV